MDSDRNAETIRRALKLGAVSVNKQAAVKDVIRAALAAADEETP